MRQEVMAYVARPVDDGRVLLDFEHRDHPDAGVQVPAGTAGPGEAIEAGLLREVEEEAGLNAAQVRLDRKPAEVYEAEYDQQRHVFELAPMSSLPDRWTHSVRGAGEDAGLVFEYFWVRLHRALTLAGEQGRFLHMAGAHG